MQRPMMRLCRRAAIRQIVGCRFTPPFPVETFLVVRSRGQLRAKKLGGHPLCERKGRLPCETRLVIQPTGRMMTYDKDRQGAAPQDPGGFEVDTAGGAGPL